MTKNYLQEIDKDISNLREWRDKEKQQLNQKIFENKKNAEIKKREKPQLAKKYELNEMDMNLDEF